MTAYRLPPHRTPRDLIDEAIDLHGPTRVLLAAFRALLRPRARPPDAGHISPHLRRDIGLPPRDDGPKRPPFGF